MTRFDDRMPEGLIDPKCLMHGKKMSEHPLGDCLYCCLCFSELTPETCYVTADGIKHDVCNECAEMEKLMMKEHGDDPATYLMDGEA